MIVLIAGCPGSGKTTLARVELARAVVREGKPALILDPEHVENFRDLPHPATVADVLRELYVYGRHAAYSNVADFERLIRAVKAGGDVALLVDEAKVLADAHRMSPALADLLRAHRHARIGTVIVTTQRLSWLHQDLLGLAERVVLFRLTSPADQKRASEEWGLDASELPRFEYVVHDSGFHGEAPAAPPGDVRPHAPGDGGSGEAPAA